MNFFHSASHLSITARERYLQCNGFLFDALEAFPNTANLSSLSLSASVTRFYSYYSLLDLWRLLIRLPCLTALELFLDTLDVNLSFVLMHTFLVRSDALFREAL